MTKTELKELIRQALIESRVRPTPIGYNAASLRTLAKLKAKAAEKAAVKAADDASLAQLASRAPNVSGKIKNIKHRIGVLDVKIAELESQIGNTDNKTPEEILEMIPTLKSKTQFEIDRLDEYINLKNALEELVSNAFNPPSVQ